MNETSRPGAGASPEDRTLVIGAGPAGLTAAWELAKHGLPAVVFEADDMVGGIARTGEYKGYRYDIGGHRFFTKVDFVQAIWEEILGDDLIRRPRLSRIHYRGKFFDYPLRPANALLGLGPVEAVRIVLSYLKARVAPNSEEKNLEQWVSNRFGWRLYEIFFKTYTEKVWGMPCTEIGADWAAQRIKNLNLLNAVRAALLPSAGRKKGEVITTLIDSFLYPRLGPGMMWERCRDLLAAKGYETRTNAPVVGIRHDGRRVTGVELQNGAGRVFEPGSHVISSMPMRDLVYALDPPPPKDVIAAADRLRYRDFLTVVLVVDSPELFPDNWIYIHSPEVKLGRIQNFKNWSPEMVPDPARTALGLEYFVQEGDELWTMADKDLVELGRVECGRIGLVDPDKVVDGCVVRAKKAYPVYDDGYKDAVDTIRRWLEQLPNLQLIGRYGQHRYNNQDHSMVTAAYAAANIAGASYDVWDVNVEEEYHEEAKAKPEAGTGRAVPMPVPTTAREDEFARLVTEAFARYDAVALGASIGTVAGVGLFLATAALILRGGKVVGPMLSLLGNYFVGYHVTWAGAFLGLVEAGVTGFLFGFLLAHLINFVVGLEETSFRRRAEMAEIQEFS